MPLVVRCPWVSLVNLNLQREAVAEILQSDLDITRAERELRAILPGGGKRTADARRLPGAAHRDRRSGASERIARRMVELLKNTPVMKIICIGRNYRAHAEELHHATGLAVESGRARLVSEARHGDAAQQRPLLHPALHAGGALRVRAHRAINRVGRAIRRALRPPLLRRGGARHRLHGPRPAARGHCRRAAVGACQGLRLLGGPSAALLPRAELGGDIRKLRFALEINGERRQTGHSAEMIFDVDRLIAAVSQYITLRMGDLLFTGTPGRRRARPPRRHPAGLARRPRTAPFDIR